MISGFLREARALPGDVLTSLRVSGWTGLRSHIIARTIHVGFKRDRLLVIEQDLRETRDVTPPAGVEIRKFAGEDWEGIDSMLTSRARVRYRRQLAAGRLCLVASRGRRVVGYTWISARMDREFETFPLALPDDAAYLWALFVVRSERGSGIGSALTSARLATARGLGFRLGWRVVSPDNKPSLRTAEKTGAVKFVGEVHYGTIFGRPYMRELRYGDQPVLTPSGAKVAG